jgi:hypothetical protein
MERYTRTQAAQLIGVTRRTLYTWLAGSTQQMFTRQEVEALAAAHGRSLEKAAAGELEQEVARLHAQVEQVEGRLEALEAMLSAAFIAPRQIDLTLTGSSSAKVPKVSGKRMALPGQKLNLPSKDTKAAIPPKVKH